MEQWTLQHHLFAYDIFVRSGELVTATQRLFRREFNVDRQGAVPSSNTILRWVENFRTTGSIMNKEPPGPSRTARTPENIAMVSETLIRSPRRSARRPAIELGLSRELVRSILETDLRFNPCKMQVVQQLNVRDDAQRVDFAVRMQVILKEKESAIIKMSDEVHFHLNGTVNKQNLRYWAPEKPCNIHERPIHSARVTVWCAVAPFWRYRALFFRLRQCNSDCLLRTLHSHAEQLLTTRTAKTTNKHEKCLFSAGRCHSARCARNNERSSKHVPWAPHFAFRRCAMAPKVS